jgi:glycosyltransferase involved in cell wall biosynthesis
VRIVLATDVYAPSVGGIERHVRSLADALAARGIDVVVATTSPHLGLDDDPSGPEVVRLPSWASTVIRRRARPEQVFHPPAADPAVVRGLAELSRRFGADLVHAHGWMVQSAVVAATRAGVPIVASLHDYGLDCARRSRQLPSGEHCPGPAPQRCRSCACTTYGPVRGRLVVAGLRRSERWWGSVDAYVANSAAVAEAAADAGTACEVASPWIAPSGPRTRTATPVPGTPTGPFVAYVGALAAHKGIATLAAAWDPAPVPLVALVSRPAADAPALPANAIVHEHADHDEVLATLARATVTVVPSSYAEPFGLVAVEAMWSGSPVVATSVGGLVDVVDRGRCGVLVAPDDPASLRTAIVDLLGDAVRRAELSIAGRRRAAQLDGTDAIVATYERVLGRQPQASPASLRT